MQFITLTQSMRDAADLKLSVGAAATSAPPLAVTAWTMLGFPLSDWVAALTLIWVSLQILNFIYLKVRRCKWFLQLTKNIRVKIITWLLSFKP